MFDTLSDRLHDVFRSLSGQSTLTEANIAAALVEVRNALLEADVNVKVAQDFVDAVGADCIGQQVVRNVTPGQQVIKIVNDRMVELLGTGESELNLSTVPSVIMLVGLHGSGKTTTAAKLANHLKTEGKKQVMLVAADVYRPAAIQQLEVLGNEIGVPVYAEHTSINVPAITAAAMEQAKRQKADVVIIDTAGRLQIDEPMVQELVRVRDAVRAQEILLVADAALGQEAVSVAEHFDKALGLSGVILTKMDGDARAGAALSIRQVTQKPIKFIGTGEKITNLEIFFPNRIVSRILGMGDVVSLVEQATAKMDEEEARRIEKNLRQNRFDFNDFLSQIRQISRMGGMESILKLLPGGRQALSALAGTDPKHLAHVEAMILSMTPHERTNPDCIDFSRRRRIAAGAGVPAEQVGTLLKQFMSMRKMFKHNGLLKSMLSGGQPSESAMASPMGMMNAPSPISRKEQERRKKLNKLKKQARAKQRKKKR